MRKKKFHLKFKQNDKDNENISKKKKKNLKKTKLLRRKLTEILFLCVKGRLLGPTKTDNHT